MKNNLKRILLLLPVISVLLVALAVPAFADATDGGSVSPFTFESCKYYNGSYLETGTLFSSDVSLNTIGTFEGGGNYQFSYLLDVDPASFTGVTFDKTGLLIVVKYLLSDGSEYAYFASSIGGSSDNTVRYAVYNVNGSSPVQRMSLDNVESLQILVADDPSLLSRFFDYTYYTVEPSPVDGFTSVWTEIMTWITSALNSVMGAFYVDGSLTLLGTLAVIGVSVGICFLLIGLIQRFLHLRG